MIWKHFPYLLLDLCEGNPPVTGWFPSYTGHDTSFVVNLNKLLNKQSNYWYLRRHASSTLWLYFDAFTILPVPLCATNVLWAVKLYDSSLINFEKYVNLVHPLSCWTDFRNMKYNDNQYVSAATNEKSWVAQWTTHLVWTNIAALSGSIVHRCCQQKNLGRQSDQYLGMFGSPDCFIGRIWRPGDRLAAALYVMTYCDN